MKRNKGFVGLVLDGRGESLISSSGALLIQRTAALSGVEKSLSEALAPWRSSHGARVHDPGKVLTDLAISVALGGDCLADIGLVRAQEELFGQVASDATVSRLIATLAADAEQVLPALRMARAQARSRVWARQRPLPGVPGSGVVVDIDATLVTAHSEKELAAPTFKRTFGFHPLFAFLDHGPGGGGETVAGMLRTGRAGANTATDHITVLDQALAQLPQGERSQVLVRTDSGGGVKQFLAHITDLGLEYSVGFYGSAPVVAALEALPRQAWRSARDADGRTRDGAQVAELTRYLPARLTGWPPGMRIIARRERPHPGAQLRLTDADGWRITCFATNTVGGRLADLEVRHRLRARAEDRIRAMKDTGLRNLPLKGFAQNQIWLEIIALAIDLITWTQHLAFHDHPVRTWEPKRMRLRIFAVAGRIIRTGRRRRLRLPHHWPWEHHIRAGYTALTAA